MIWGGTSVGKENGKGQKGPDAYTYSLLVSTVVWLCPVPKYLSLSYLLIKFLSNPLLGEWLSILCAWRWIHKYTQTIYQTIYICCNIHTSVHRNSPQNECIWTPVLYSKLYVEKVWNSNYPKHTEVVVSMRWLGNSVFFKMVNMEIYTESKLYFKTVLSIFLQTQKYTCIRTLF